MNNNRPINLNLATIGFPVTAITSILHRISGVVLFLCMPIVLWGLSSSLKSEQSFHQIQSMLSDTILGFITWIFLSAIIYHFFAGIRHLLMDFGVGEELATAKVTAMMVLILSIMGSFLSGVYLWSL